MLQMQSHMKVDDIRASVGKVSFSGVLADQISALVVIINGMRLFAA